MFHSVLGQGRLFQCCHLVKGMSDSTGVIHVPKVLYNLFLVNIIVVMSFYKVLLSEWSHVSLVLFLGVASSHWPLPQL